MFVVIGNPPYNIGQVNENDNNKNRKYPTMDRRVRDTFSKDSKATNKNALADPYVKAISLGGGPHRRGRSGRLCDQQRFLDGVASDGMRKHLANDLTPFTSLIWAVTCARIPSSPARPTMSLVFKLVSASFPRQEKR